MLTCVDVGSATFDLWSSWHLRLAAFSGTIVRSFALHAHLDLYLRTPRTFQPPAKHFPVCEGVVSLISQLAGLHEMAFAWRRWLAPNSSSSEARLNPNEPILWFLVNSSLKASPPQIGVETKLFVSVVMFCKKSLHAISPQNWLRWLRGDFYVQPWWFLGAVHFEVRCSPWFNDVVLYFWFHAF
jgi:hypothetical protein